MDNRDTPYKGLMPYEEDDAPFFFGREKWRQIIIDNLMASRLTVLYGASGVGKSSVLRAGVAYQLREIARRNMRESGALKMAPIVFNSWRDEPLLGFTEQVAEDIQTLLAGRVTEPVPTCSRLDRVLGAWTERIGGKNQIGELFVILDQFEEYFLYHPQESGEGTFAFEFPRAVNSPDLLVNFLISIRKDSLAKLDRFKGHIFNLLSNRLHIEHLDEESASDAIRKPVQEYNRRHTSDHAPVGVEPNLVEAVLEQVKTGKVLLSEEGRGAITSKPEIPPEDCIETPYLQLVMTRLWKEEIGCGSHRLRLDTLKNLGGAGQIVKEHLDARMNRLPPEAQDTAADVFTYLVTPSCNKIAHTVGDLVSFVAGGQRVNFIKSKCQQVQLLLEELSSGESRILRPIGPPTRNPDAGERYEIFHDVLAAPILNWRQRYQEHRRLEAEKQKLKTENEKRKAKFLSIFGAVALVTIVIFVGLLMVWRSEKEKVKVKQALLAENAKIQIINAVTSRMLYGYILFMKNWIEFDSPQQLDTLLRAMQVAGKIERIGEIEFKEPKKSLERILIDVRQKNQFPIDIPSNIFITSADVSVTAQKLATGSIDGWLYLWDLKGEKLAGFEVGEFPVSNVSFSPDGQTLATGSTDGKVRLWDLQGKAQGEFDIGDSRAIISFSPDVRKLVTILSNGAVRFLDLEGQVLRQFYEKDQDDGKKWVAASVSSDGQTIALAAADSTIRFTRLRGDTKAVFKGPTSPTTNITFSPDGQMLTTVSLDNTVHLWDMEGHEQDRFPHPNKVLNVRFSTDNRQLLSITRDGTVRFWKLQKPCNSKIPQEKIVQASFSPDGQKLAAASRDGKVYLWDLKGEKLEEFRFEASLVSSVSFSPDGEKLATGSTDGTVRLWDSKGRQQAQFDGGEGLVAVSFGPDGQKLATASRDGKVYLWDLKGEKLAEFSVAKFSVNNVSFSPDGQKLATASRDGKVYLLDFKGEKLAEFRVGETSVTKVSFSPDGLTLATASADGAIFLWNRKGEPLEKFQSHGGMLKGLAFIHDGKQLATASIDGDIHLWPVTQWSLLELEDPLARGCKYLAEFFETHPIDKEKLAFCMGD